MHSAKVLKIAHKRVFCSRVRTALCVDVRSDPCSFDDMPSPSSVANVGPSDPRVRAWNDRPVRRGDHVVYWAQATRRAEDNVALEYAIARANELALPIVVYEALRPDYPFASDRIHTFVLECARDAAMRHAARGIPHGFFLPKTRDEARGVAARVFERAALIVSDENPSFLFPSQNAAAAKQAPCSYVTVDDTAVVPLSLIAAHESQARTIRGKLLAELPRWLVDVEELTPRHTPSRFEWPFHPFDPARGDLAAAVQMCAIDHEIKPIRDRPGGSVAACDRLRRFLAGSGRSYDTARDDAPADATSGLSPYLHFGAISARRCLLSLRDAKVRPAARVAFIEQLLVRRGLAFNHAARCPEHATYAAVPPWARASLSLHAKDPRPEACSLEDLERGRSGDEVWNAAQHELVTRGRMHNVMRMFWGKRLLQLIGSPEHAFAFGTRMWDRYALDGRDPNTYAGVSWCFGLHDRPFPERAIFGSVRPMGRGALKKRFDLDEYVASTRATLFG